MIPHNSGKLYNNGNKIIILDFKCSVICIHIMMILSSVTNEKYDFITPSESRYLDFHSSNVYLFEYLLQKFASIRI